MGNADNVVVGVGDVYVSPVGTALPTQTGGVFTFGAGWTNVGYTKDGVEVLYSQEIFEGKVDQELSPVVRMLMGEKMSIKTKLAETTIENIQRAIPASTLSTAGGLKTLHMGGGALSEIQVAFCGKGGVDELDAEFQRVFILYRSQSDAPVNIGHKANDLTVLDVTWTALADSTKPKGKRLGCIMEPV